MVQTVDESQSPPATLVAAANPLHNRKGFFRGLDVVGYVPGVGILSGVVRIIIAKVAELFCTVAAVLSSNTKKVLEGYKRSDWEFSAKYYTKEAKRGALEIIPFATIVYDLRASYLQKKSKTASDTLAFGQSYSKHQNDKKICFSWK